MTRQTLGDRLLSLPDMTALLGDVLEERPELGSASSADGLLPRTPTARMAGPAALLRLRPAAAGERLSHDPLLAAAETGAVAVIDTGGHDQGAVLGGRLARRGLAAGVRGYVVAGAVRDVEDLAGVGLAVLSTRVHPVGARRTLAADPEAHEVEVCGLSVRAGDLVAADPNGLVVLHRATAAEAVSRAEEIAAQESGELAATGPTPEEPGAWD